MQPARRQRRHAAAFDEPDRARVLLEHVSGKMLHIFIVGTMHHVHDVVCAGAQAATGVRSSQEQHRAQTPQYKTLNPFIIKPPEPAWRVELRVQCCAVAAARPRHSWGRAFSKGTTSGTECLVARKLRGTKRCCSGNGQTGRLSRMLPAKRLATQRSLSTGRMRCGGGADMKCEVWYDEWTGGGQWLLKASCCCRR